MFMCNVKGEIVRKYVSVVPNRIKQEKLMDLNTKLGPISFSLNFWDRLALGFIF